MIKACPVIMTNEYVTVVKFDDKKIQLPAIHNNDKLIMVMLEGGKYSIVNNNSISGANALDESEKFTKRRNYKKTTHSDIDKKIIASASVQNQNENE